MKKNVKVFKKLLAYILGGSILVGALTGCSKDEGVHSIKYSTTISTGDDDFKETTANYYINGVSFTSDTFKNSVINGYKSDVLEKEDYEKLTELTISSVDDLTDLSLTPNLKKLTIKSSDLKNIDKIGDLKKLESISISYCNLDNYDFLKNLPKLKEISLYDVNNEDLSVLGSLNLEKLQINGMQVKDWSFLNNLDMLKELDVSATNFDDINNISNLKKLEKLDISYTYINNIDGISNNNKKIKEINVASCHELKDLTELNNLKKLNEIKDFNMEMNLEENEGNKELMRLDGSTTYDDDDVKQDVTDFYNSLNIKDNMSDKQKVQIISGAVCDKLDYQSEINAFSADDANTNEISYALDNGEGICCNYAGLTNALLDLADVPNYEVLGECFDNTAEDRYLHEWNVVKIGDNWYGLDNCFADENGSTEEIKNGGNPEYYLDDFSEEEWERLHQPYAMPSEISYSR